MDLQAIPQHLDESLSDFRSEMLDCVAAVARQAGAQGHPDVGAQGGDTGPPAGVRRS